jgi:hypothetical protein
MKYFAAPAPGWRQPAKGCIVFEKLNAGCTVVAGGRAARKHRLQPRNRLLRKPLTLKLTGLLLLLGQNLRGSMGLKHAAVKLEIDMIVNQRRKNRSLMDPGCSIAESSAGKGGKLAHSARGGNRFPQPARVDLLCQRCLPGHAAAQLLKKDFPGRRYVNCLR